MDARSRYDDVVDELLARHGDAERAQMMGMPSVKANGKLVAGFRPAEDAMVFKLSNPVAHGEALLLAGAHLFDPSGRGRPMKAWIVVPAEHAAEWPRLAEIAIASK